MDEVNDWLEIAYSNLKRGKSYYKLIEDEIRLEEFCYDLQQCTEKSLKALLIKYHINFPKTHSIEKLLTLLVENSIDVPKEIVNSAPLLTQFAIDTRYPGDWEPITEDDYKEMVTITEKVYDWVKDTIKIKE